MPGIWDDALKISEWFAGFSQSINDPDTYHTSLVGNIYAQRSRVDSV